MHRVELKDHFHGIYFSKIPLFLMHRVELKDGHTLRLSLPLRVPNAPCGVESSVLALDVYVAKGS